MKVLENIVYIVDFVFLNIIMTHYIYSFLHLHIKLFSILSFLINIINFNQNWLISENLKKICIQININI